MTDTAGTIGYMAPEMIKKQGYGRNCDVWSLGIITYIMLLGEPLFTLTDDKKAKHQITSPIFVRKRMEEAQGRISEDAHDLLVKMLDRDPKTRIQASDALAHPFVMKTYMAGASGGAAGSDEMLSMDEVIFKMRKYAELPLLKRTALTVLAHMVGTAQESMQKPRVTFRKLDTDGGGSLSKEEFIDGVKREGGTEETIPADFDEVIWPGVDLNQSDDINFTEFLAACLADDEATVYSENHWKGVFQVLDASATGSLDLADLQELFPGNEVDELEKMLPDGKSIDEAAFVKMMVEH